MTGISNSAFTCPYCGKMHATRCPDVKAFEYHPDGTVKRVEFFGQSDYQPVDVGRFLIGPAPEPTLVPPYRVIC